jgi:NitT/TauT family transport system permease protein
MEHRSNIGYGLVTKAMGMAIRRQTSTIISLVGAAVAWELAVRLFAVPEYILPAPSRVFSDLVKNLHVVLPAAYFTLEPMILGFLMAVVLGVAVSLVVVYSHVFEAVL